jgi:hypothetical protein
LSVEAAVHTLDYVYIVGVRDSVWAGQALGSKHTESATFASEAMEAVAAVGVAAAAMQFFEITAKALKTYSEIRQSIKGESKFNEDLGKSVHELQQIQSSLNAPLSGNDPQTSAVISIRNECNEIAKGLLSRLQSVQPGRKGWRRSVQATFRTIHEVKNIRALEQRYRDCQSKFQEALSVEMRNAIAVVLQEQGKTNDALLNVVLPRVDARFDRVQSSLEYKTFLDSLFFPDMFARHRNIDPPSTGTYEWIFNQDAEEDEKDQANLGKFKRWLCSDEPYFWINGKAGSGKSSLMSFIESDERTEEALKSWAGPRELHIFSFFFWRPGSDLQKSITGLLQTLLYQLVKRKPAIIGGLLSADRTLVHSVWTETTLLRTIAQALSLYGNDSLFLLIDGLDEFEGPYLRMLDTLFKLQSGPNVKICLSSRPETALVKRLGAFPSLCLQDINRRDIESFVRRTLKPHQDVANDEIIFDVVDRSEGIFLWAALVCKSLVSGYDAGDDEKVIQQRLNATPAGLKALITHMFHNIEDVHRDSLSVYFGLLKFGEASVALVTVVLHGKPFDTLQQYSDECRLMKHRILAQSKGLIELNERGDFQSDLEWAFVDVSSGKIRSDFLQEAERKNLDRYERMDLRWVHRSAYDCILDSSSHDLAASLLPSNELDLARRALAAAAWLAKHTTQIAVISPASTPTCVHECMYSTLRTIVQFCKIRDIGLTEEVYEVLDDLFDTMQSSLYADGGIIWQQVLSKCAFPWSVRRPLVGFWNEVSKLDEIDRYLLPRLERLERSGFAAEPLGFLINNIMGNAPEVLPLVSYKALDALLRLSGSGTHHAFGFGTARLGENSKVVWEYCIFSFMGRDLISEDKCATEHAYMIFGLHMAANSALRMLRDGSHESWHDFNTQLLQVCEAWQMFFGVAARREPERLTLLQIQWPQTHTSRLPDSSIPETISLRWPRRIMRLLCLDVKQIATGPIVDFEVFKVIACFNVSEGCSKAIGDLEIDHSPPLERFADLTDGLKIDSLPPLGRFEEPMGAERCLQLLLDDIWADQEKQLDAWQQLYSLACVKKSFKHLWIAKSK